jgi:hypothetical protein
MLCKVHALYREMSGCMTIGVLAVQYKHWKGVDPSRSSRCRACDSACMHTLEIMMNFEILEKLVVQPCCARGLKCAIGSCRSS